MGFTSFDKIVPKVFKKAGVADKMLPVLAMAIFKQMMKEFIGPHADELLRPVGIENNILEVVCLNKETAEKLWDNRREIADGINAELGKKVIYYIKINR